MVPERKRTRRAGRNGVAAGVVAACLVGLALAGCRNSATLSVAQGTGPNPELPPPEESLFPTVAIAPAVGWNEGARPNAATGLAVEPFARGLEHPRWLYVLPNGDVLVAETAAPPSEAGGGIKGLVMGLVMKRAGAAVASANRITLLRDADGDGRAEVQRTFLDDLNSPFGMALVGADLYVANTDALLKFPYTDGATSIAAGGEHVAALPAGPINQHWTRNVVASPDGERLYVTVGSNSNIGEHGLDTEERRAAILEVNPASGAVSVFASGLRNPNGLAWHPDTGALWTVVNERDGIGGDLVPDYLTSVRRDDFFGWPYSYFGTHVDERVEPQAPERVAQTRVPDYALGPHTASIGLAYYEDGPLPEAYRGGVFVGQHGSWNRNPLSGYKVLFVPFADGRPSGMPRDVLTGFVDANGKAQGRPVGVAVDADGALLVADDVGNAVWRVTAARAAS
jgi:glucose/arabinose dehydrogenase